MRYAVIADVHGNAFALEAVLADAKAHGAELFLFLGDYYQDLPFANEVADLMRSVPNVAIRGNKEQRLEYAAQADWGDSLQMRPLMSAMRDLKPENYAYYTGLPDTAEVTTEDGAKLFLDHAWSVIFRNPKIPAFHSTPEFTRLPHEQYVEAAKANFLARQEAVAELTASLEGVYLFGHNHMPFHMEYGRYLIVNPGSCGMNFHDRDAHYAILERSGGEWKLYERQVQFDVEAAVSSTLKWTKAIGVPIWGELVATHLRSGIDVQGKFIKHLYALAGQDGGVVSNEIWELGIKSFDMNAHLS